MKRRLYNYEKMTLEDHLVLKSNQTCQEFILDSNMLKVYKLTIPKLEKEKYTKIHIPFSYTSPTEVYLTVYQIDNIDITNCNEVKNQYSKHKTDSAIYKLTLECAHINNKDECYMKHNIIDLTKSKL